MLFNSYEFIFVFLPVTLLFFYLLGGRGLHEVAMSWLVGASLFFYGWWNPAYLALIVFSMVVNYSLGVALERVVRRKLVFVVGIVFNLCLIAYFKYANFFVDSFNDVAETSFHLEVIILPLAISFFTFQQIAYLADAYKGLTKEYNALHYCLFVTFFPQLIAGPIVHHKEMMPQFTKTSIFNFSYNAFSIGLTIFLIGLFKKVVIADSAAIYAAPVFETAGSEGPLSFYLAWGGALSYTVQLYFDFSGYSDMAIGLAKMFGINLPVNFNSPYKSVNIIEFWRRWHMTLSRFLRDYLYIPLGGSQKGKPRRYINLMITMLLGGLWHGAGWTFVIWGALHGFYLMINHAFRAVSSKLDLRGGESKIRVVASTLLTFMAVVVSWVFFRAESYDAAIYMLGAMVDFTNLSEIKAETFAKVHILSLIISLFIIFCIPNTLAIVSNISQAESSSSKDLWSRLCSRFQWQPSTVWGVVLGVMFAVTLVMLERESEFLYFQF